MKPKITEEDFAKEYARRSDVTVAWLKDNGRTSKRCDCDWEGCEGWQMGHDDNGYTLGYSSPSEPDHLPPSDDELDVEVGVEGWRTMSVGVDDDGLFLLGSYGGKHRSRETVEAECSPGGPTGMTWITYGGNEPKLPKHSAPHKKCKCGFYATDDLSLGYSSVTARVSAAGRTIKAEKGWRSARFRIEELFVSEPELIEPLAAQFQVPVLLRKELLCRSVRQSKSSEPSLSQTS